MQQFNTSGVVLHIDHPTRSPVNYGLEEASYFLNFSMLLVRLRLVSPLSTPAEQTHWWQRCLIVTSLFGLSAREDARCKVDNLCNRYFGGSSFDLNSVI